MAKPARKPSPAPATGPRKLRVLVLAHLHPEVTSGGAEISAYALFRGLQRQPGVQAWFVGGSHIAATSRPDAGFTQPFGADNFVYQLGQEFDSFRFANRDPRYPAALQSLVAKLQPDIVHAHHYVNFGIETFWLIRRAWPAARIVLTLHEFLAICHHHGQFVKTNGSLCHRESSQDCAACFPQIAAQAFFLRKRYIQSFLADVDAFIAPSHFLAERYAAWGLERARMTIMDNVAGQPQAAAPAPAPAGARTLRFAYFGQMSPSKGIGLLIAAATRIAAEGAPAQIDIHGDYTRQPAASKAEVEAALAAAPPGVTYHGPYPNGAVHGLMQRYDAILVPSLWWENAPVVIQEAFAARRPVICADIGGMAERVRPGLDGFHFEAGQPASLAALLAGLMADPARLDRLQQTLAQARSQEAGVRAHLDLYRALPAPAG